MTRFRRLLRRLAIWRMWTDADDASPSYDTAIRSIEQLNALPLFAVVMSHDNRVYQKQLNDDRHGWCVPGDMFPYGSHDIALTAHLLDDGR